MLSKVQAFQYCAIHALLFYVGVLSTALIVASCKLRWCFPTIPLLEFLSLRKSADTEERQQYESLVRIGGEEDWCNEGGKVEDYRLAATAFRIIDEDVNRTNVRDSEERERTRHILRAFALKNPSTGYCQVITIA